MLHRIHSGQVELARIGLERRERLIDAERVGLVWVGVDDYT